MDADNNSPKEDTAPAIEQSERAIQRIEDISKDKAVDLGAKKTAAQKLHDEKTKAYEEAKGKGTSKGDREARRLGGEIRRLNTAIERIDQRLKVIARESTEDKVDEAQKLMDRADELHNRAGIIESRDDVADKRDMDVAELRVKEGEQTAIIDNPDSTPEAKTAALKERADIREKIEWKESHTDRAEEKLKREALLRAEAQQILADTRTAEQLEASLHEPSSDSPDGKKQEATGEKTRSFNLTERMSSTSELTALEIADNPPKKGDFAGNMVFNLKLVWLKISMAMSPKPLAWNPKKFDEGRREILAKVAGMKLTDTEDGKMMIDSVPRDRDYEAPLGGTQRVFREYFGTKWWTTLNGVTGPTKDKPGTKLSEFKAGIPNPPSSEEDKAKQAFVDDLTKAGMKDDEQLLPWLEKNSSKVKKEGAEQTESSGVQVAPSVEGVNSPERSAFQLDEAQILEIIDTNDFNSQTPLKELINAIIVEKLEGPIADFFSDALKEVYSPNQNYQTLSEKILVGTDVSEPLPLALRLKYSLKIIDYAKSAFPAFQIPDNFPNKNLEDPNLTLSAEEIEIMKPVLTNALTLFGEAYNKPVIEILSEHLANVKSPEDQASTQRGIDALKANDTPATPPATQVAQTEVTQEVSQSYPFLDADQILQLKSYPGFKSLEVKGGEAPDKGDSTQLSFNRTTHDFTVDGAKVSNASSFVITPGTDKVSVQVDDGKLTITIIEKAKEDGSVASKVLVVQPKPAPAE